MRGIWAELATGFGTMTWFRVTMMAPRPKRQLFPVQIPPRCCSLRPALVKELRPWWIFCRSRYEKAKKSEIFIWGSPGRLFHGAQLGGGVTGHVYLQGDTDRSFPRVSGFLRISRAYDAFGSQFILPKKDFVVAAARLPSFCIPPQMLSNRQADQNSIRSLGHPARMDVSKDATVRGVAQKLGEIGLRASAFENGASKLASYLLESRVTSPAPLHRGQYFLSRALFADFLGYPCRDLRRQRAEWSRSAP